MRSAYSIEDLLTTLLVPEENQDGNDHEEEEERDLEEEEEEEEDEEVCPQLSGEKTSRRRKEHRSADPFGLVPLDDSEVIEEEELEWISNKDAFPVIETFVDVLPMAWQTNLFKQPSPVSVLETSNQSTTNIATMVTNSSDKSMAVAKVATVMSRCEGGNVPVKARSKRCRMGRHDYRSLRIQIRKERSRKKSAAVIGRKCQHCGAEKTPQWRTGPLGPKTLCNACGVRFKSGRLVPEYRPASSPTFLAELHSNSHRKIIEMRRQQQVEALSRAA